LQSAVIKASILASINIKNMCEGNLFDVRNEFTNGSLSKKDLHSNPVAQFSYWLDKAKAHETEPTAFVLSTCDMYKRVSSRVLLLKEFSEKGFVFFTNYSSKKGKQLNDNNQASILFYWPVLQKQIRIEGCIEKTSPELSDNYFNSRPMNSRLSAVASQQSEKTDSRQMLEDKIAKLNPSDVRRPETWGGYVLKPHYYEFWQGRENRLHDRFVYEKNNLGWEIYRIQP